MHRKEYELKAVRAAHASTTDPVRMAMSYAQESPNAHMRLARALRRVHENHVSSSSKNENGNGNDKDKDTQSAKPNKTPSGGSKSPNYPPIHKQRNHPRRDDQKKKPPPKLVSDLGLRRASVVIDIKRQSRGRTLCQFDDAGIVAEAMVQPPLGADVVMVNTDYVEYGGDLTELKSAVRAVRKVSDTAAVVMKDIVVDEIQLGLAKEAGADAILLMASVLGSALGNFLDLATLIGLETIVECHTRNEVEEAMRLMATNIFVNNYDRVHQQYYPDQARQLAGLFPGSGGPVICLAGGGLTGTHQIRQHLSVGYDAVVLGRAVMGNPRSGELIRFVRDRTFLPAEMSSWGVNADFDQFGNLMEKRDGQKL